MYTFLDWAIIRCNLIRLKWHFLPEKARQYKARAIIAAIVSLWGILGVISCLSMARVAHG